MWIIGKAPLDVISNNPADSIAQALRKKHPGHIIYRTEEPVFNEFAALAYAQETVPGPDVEVTVPDLDESGAPVLDENGDPVMITTTQPGPMEWVSVGNTFAIEGAALVVRDKLSAELASYPLVEVQ